MEAASVDLRARGLAAATLDYFKSPDWRAVEADGKWASEPGHLVLTLSDAGYPAPLKEISDPPPLLFVQGEPAWLSSSQLAVVGSRNPTPAGEQTAFAFSKALVEQGLCITSGLALGIDAAAHEGALEGGGATVAVAATGLDRVYPRRHAALAEKIAQAGAIVSEFPLGTPPIAQNFPRRNRIISGLSLGTLVVEAALQSGSIISARHALEQGREVFAIPGSIHNPLARGCHALIRQGAKLVETVEDILEEIRFARPLSKTASSPVKADLSASGMVPVERLDDEYRRLLECLGFDATSVDTLVDRSGLTADVVSSMLLILELQGHVNSHMGGTYARRSVR
jgi:DNA processing protein